MNNKIVVPFLLFLILLLNSACSKDSPTNTPIPKEDPTVAVTGIDIVQSDFTLHVGEFQQLSAALQPANATNKSIDWESSEQAIASVDNSGKVTAIGPGTSIISVTSNENAQIKAQVTVEVLEEPSASAFITTWNTELGTPSEPTVVIPTFSGEIYDYSIDWGDGETESNLTGDATHVYQEQGTYQVKITGQFPRIYFNYQFTSTGVRKNLISVDQWGSGEWTSMELAFAGCDNLDVLATDLPNLSMVSSMNEMFSLCRKLEGNLSINSWDVSTITDMGALFAQCDAFNMDISSWDVGKVEDMSGMFLGCDIFNQNIGGWDVSSVKDMGSMFSETSAFNQDIGNWTTGQVTTMQWMFASNTIFNQNIGAWDVSNVIDMSYMFLFATSFDQDLGSWNVSEVKDMTNIFDGTQLSTLNYDALLEGWNSLTSLQVNVSFDGGNSQYCSSESARQNIMTNYGWTISDGGLNCD
ncbi:BspA family leucine-rich repeat surface protein [Flavobacteriaceae bacterium TP-CH-4]|uniref:BspA family leucine-rich repeat surface protein n=1 Tax=Pelagihabitans pacificus TaxID=2696054 RepID=A0A967AX28_9FLAO|nr:BspA family leucine-rich repeat surface protein [Pelagihabitans pacificus]NHF59172.1 BspA family leucine-rich repeat surface protein [Pelagihabitans pacificus]